MPDRLDAGRGGMSRRIRAAAVLGQVGFLRYWKKYMAIYQGRIAEHRSMRAVLGLLIAGTVAMPARAQSVQEPVNELAFNAELRHDSNVTGANAVSPAFRDLKESDERLNVGVSLLLARPLGRHSVSVDAFVGYDFYRHNSRLNSERIAFAGDLVLNAGPCSLDLRPQYNRRQSNLYDIAYINVPGINSVRNTETTQVYRGELRCGSATGIRPLAYYERSYGDNSNPLRQLSDYRGESYGGGLSYTHPVVGQFDLSVGRTNMDYPNRGIGDLTTGYQEDEIRLAASRDIGSVLTAHGYVAYTHLKPKNGIADDFKGASWSLGVTAVPTANLQLRANFAQNLEPSLGNNALYMRERSWSLAGTYQLGVKTSATLAASRNERVYRGAVALIGLPLTTDRMDRISGRVDFRPSQRLAFGLEVGHERRKANDSFYDYKNTYAALSARFILGSI